MAEKQILIIGGAVADVSLAWVDASIFTRHSTPIQQIRLSTGGDAMNESSVLARLGDRVSLLTLLGNDDMGAFLEGKCRELGIDLTHSVRRAGVPTSINGVLVDEQGERRFVTMKNSTLRRLAPEHVLPAVETLTGKELVSFASLFVSPCFGPRELETLFSRIKEKGCVLCADMTRCKNGESAEDLRGALQYVDYLLPNLEEAALLTGEKTPEAAASRLLACGAGNVILKLGREGGYYAGREGRFRFPAYPHSQTLDTTGAGDTFAGSFLHGLAQELPLDACLRFASAAASICVEHAGCASETLTLEEIRRREAYLESVFHL